MQHPCRMQSENIYKLYCLMFHIFTAIVFWKWDDFLLIRQQML